MSGDYEQTKLRVCQSEGAYATMRPLASSWEQRKLNQFIYVTSEKNVDGAFVRGDVLSVSREEGVVNQIEFQGRSFAGADVSVYGILRHGDIVYTKSPLRANPYGIIKTNKGRSGIVSTLYATYRARPGVDSDFIQCYFDQDARLNNYLHPLVNKGAKNDMKVSAENAITGNVCFPGCEEQRLISSLFDRLDNLITLHQREPPHMMKEGKNANQYQRRISFL